MKNNQYIKVLLLIVIVFLGSLVVGIFVQNNSVSLKIDGYLYNLIANGTHFKFLDILFWPINNNFLFVGLSTLPSYFFIMNILFLLYLSLFKRKDLGWAIVALLIASILIGLIYSFDSHFIFRHRPYETLTNNLSDNFKNALKNWNSYPSGHSRDTAVYSVIIAYFIPILTIPLIIFTFIVGYSRIYVGAHYPTDVIVGIIIGFLIGKISIIITNELRKIFLKWKEKKHEKEKQN